MANQNNVAFNVCVKKSHIVLFRYRFLERSYYDNPSSVWENNFRFFNFTVKQYYLLLTHENTRTQMYNGYVITCAIFQQYISM